MSGVNKVILIGNLGSDPEVRYTASNEAVATLRLATNEVWTDRDGKRQERTEWHRVVAWGRLAEICKEHLSKGRQIYVEGSLQTREWQDKDNNKRFTTEIKAHVIQFLGGGHGESGGERRGGNGGGRSSGPEDYGDGGGGGGGRPASRASGPEDYGQPSPPRQPAGNGGFSGPSAAPPDDDDIKF